MHITKLDKEPIIRSTQDLQFQKKKYKKNLKWIILYIVFVFLLIMFVNTYFNLQLLFSILLSFFIIVVTVMIFIALVTRKGKQDLVLIKHWFDRNGFTYDMTSLSTGIPERIAANPSKKFFGIRHDYEYLHRGKGPYATGYIGNRQAWIYRVVVLSVYSGGTGFLAKTSNEKLLFNAWCVEIATHQIPISAIITKRYLQTGDNIDTESRSFEKLYDVKVRKHASALQLLEPNMINLITHSRIAAIEFSDSSVVLYNADTPPMIEILDTMLEQGLKIAKQVDRNFPLGKYEKN